MKILNYIKQFILYIWQLPQNILGLILLLFYKKEKIYHRLNGRTFYYTNEMRSGVSLGNYIIMNWKDKEDGMKHEYGHSIQSRILGPLYLLTVGLCSAVGSLIDIYIHTEKNGWSYEKAYTWYYQQWQEKWADKLGNVERKFSRAPHPNDK